jgi:hypothetical protein
MMAVVALGFTFSGGLATANSLDDWRAFAASSGKEKHAKWVELISDPEAVALAKEWADFRGYTASSLIAAADIPAELKPGLIINKENVDSFPWLAKYLPAGSLNQIKSNKWFSWDQIVIVPTNTYYMPGTTLKATKEVIEKKLGFTINEKGELLAADGSYGLLSPKTAAAMPFTNPKNGLELNWLNVANGVGNDNVLFKPVVFHACNSSNKLERKYEAYLWWQKFHGRTLLPPFGSVAHKEDFVQGGALYFLKPRDIRGLAGVRLRYAAVDKDDSFQVFLPGLKRTRILSGSDAQDPLAAGLEITWDEWRGYWQKTDPRKFSYSMAGEGFVLVQPEVGRVYDPFETKGNGCQVKSVEMELRPVWILEITDKTHKYQYSKRRIYIDKESYILQYAEMYDKRGNLWRVWDDARYWDPKTGASGWRNVVEWNLISKRMTELLQTEAWGEDLVKSTPPSIFDIDQLRDFR